MLCLLLTTVARFDFLFMGKSVAWATLTTLYSTWWLHVTKLGALRDERKKEQKRGGKRGERQEGIKVGRTKLNGEVEFKTRKAAISILNCYNKLETENIQLSDKVLTGNLQGKTSQKVAVSII